MVGDSCNYPEQEDHVVSVPKMHRLKPYEKFLKTFKYKKALAAALQVYLTLLG